MYFNTYVTFSFIAFIEGTQVTNVNDFMLNLLIFPLSFICQHVTNYTLHHLRTYLLSDTIQHDLQHPSSLSHAATPWMSFFHLQTCKSHCVTLLIEEETFLWIRKLDFKYPCCYEAFEIAISICPCHQIEPANYIQRNRCVTVTLWIWCMSGHTIRLSGFWLYIFVVQGKPVYLLVT